MMEYYNRSLDVSCSYVGNVKNVIDELYDEEKYKGYLIEKMDNSKLIEAIIDLRTEATENKQEVEFYFLDNKAEIKKYKKLFGARKDFFIKLAKQDVEEWLEDLPLYNALVDEVVKRKLGEYLDIILEKSEVK